MTSNQHRFAVMRKRVVLADRGMNHIWTPFCGEVPYRSRLWCASRPLSIISYLRRAHPAFLVWSVVDTDVLLSRTTRADQG